MALTGRHAFTAFLRIFTPMPANQCNDYAEKTRKILGKKSGTKKNIANIMNAVRPAEPITGGEANED